MIPIVLCGLRIRVFTESNDKLEWRDASMVYVEFGNKRSIRGGIGPPGFRDFQVLFSEVGLLFPQDNHFNKSTAASWFI